MCWNEPSMFIDSRFAFASCRVDERGVTTTPTSATTTITPPPGVGRVDQPPDRPRRRSGTRARAAWPPFACAERISVRFSPKVRLPPAGRRTRRSTISDSSERARVGEHVRRVREQRERVGEDAGDHLADHEADDQRERDPEPARVGVGADDRVRVAGVRVAAVVVRAHAAERTPRARSARSACAVTRGRRRRTMPPVILDGHDDLALRRWRGDEPKHIDLARAAEAASAAASSRCTCPCA